MSTSTTNTPEIKTYEPYGKATLTGPGTAYDPFGYASGYTSSAAPNLVHFGLRFYDPNIQRWTQPDQLNMPADLRQANKYAYLGADPINGTDRAGTCITDWLCDAADTVGGAIDDTTEAVWNGAGDLVEYAASQDAAAIFCEGAIVTTTAVGFAAGGPPGAAAGAAGSAGLCGALQTATYPRR